MKKTIVFIFKILAMWSILMLASNTAYLISESWWIKAPFLLGMGVVMNMVVEYDFLKPKNK